MDPETQGHMDVIASYGRALEHHDAPVRDVRELPHSKQRIKEALGFALVNFDLLYRDEALRGLLREGFLMLADFQDHGGNPPTVVAEMSDTADGDGAVQLTGDMLQGTEALREALMVVEQERALLAEELKILESHSVKVPQ